MLRLYNPEVYQGPLKLKHNKGYFEGWYFKFVTESGQSLAIIPGVSLGKSSSKAFIQTIVGDRGITSYTEFPIDEFEQCTKPFSLKIGRNRFSLKEIEIGDRIAFSGKISMESSHHYKTSFLKPGIMGWYRYVPAMECYHGLVSMGHLVRGQLKSKNESFNLEGAKAYIEKDWGTSFPSSYIWMQSNDFQNEPISFMLSVARIPWLRSYFRGFLGYFLWQGKIITFSTYTNSKLEIDVLDPKNVVLTIVGQRSPWKNSLKKGNSLRIKANREIVGSLQAPQLGLMERRINESLDAKIEIEYFIDNQLVFSRTSGVSGLEIVGERDELIN